MNSTSSNSLLLAIAIAVSVSLLPSAQAANLWNPSYTTVDLWLDAADSSKVIESGGLVSQWNDKSGNSRNASQGVAADQPTYVLGAQNGENVIRFDGSSDFFELGTGLDFIAGNSHRAFAVMQNSTYSNLYGAADGSSGSSSLHVGLRDAASYRINYWSNDYYPPITSNYDVGMYNLLSWDWQAGTSKTVEANAKLEGTNGSAGTPTAMAGGGRIMNVVGQGFMQADLGELIIFQGTPSDETVDLIEGYLAWKWGIQGNLPIDHPYANAAPVPEPSTVGIAMLGLIGAFAVLRRR